MTKSSPVSATASIAFEDECVAFFAEIVQLFGLPKSVGQIYGLLYVSPEPLSFSAIVERLEISKGSASQGLQLLRLLGAINVADPLKPQAGHLPSSEGRGRGPAYKPELSLRKLMSGVLQGKIKPLATTGEDRLERLRILAKRDGEGSAFYLDRVRQLDIWRRRLKTVLPLLSALLGSKAAK